MSVITSVCNSHLSPTVVSVRTHLTLNQLPMHAAINLGFIPSLHPLVELLVALVDGTLLESTQVVLQCFLAEEVFADRQDGFCWAAVALLAWWVETASVVPNSLSFGGWCLLHSGLKGARSFDLGFGLGGRGGFCFWFGRHVGVCRI